MKYVIIFAVFILSLVLIDSYGIGFFFFVIAILIIIIILIVSKLKRTKEQPKIDHYSEVSLVNNVIE